MNDSTRSMNYIMSPTNNQNKPLKKNVDFSIYVNWHQKYPNRRMHSVGVFYMQKSMLEISQQARISGANFLYGKIDMLIYPKIRS